MRMICDLATTNLIFVFFLSCFVYRMAYLIGTPHNKVYFWAAISTDIFLVIFQEHGCPEELGLNGF